MRKPLAKLAIIFLFLLLGLFFMALIKSRVFLRKPNIIFISIETTRADHLGCYGYGRNTSPTIDKFASQGVLFSNMFVQRGQTWPSLTSIMTSLYPVNHGVRRNGDMLSDSVVSLAEILKQNAYICGTFLAYGVDAVWRGFDYKFTKEEDDIQVHTEAIKWLRDNYYKRFFLWLHYFQPHKPYNPPKPYDTLFDPEYNGTINASVDVLKIISRNKIKLNKEDLNHIVSLYDGSIYFVDACIKELLECVRTLGIEDNTLIIITSDHGEVLYKPHFYFAHDASIYDDVLHIPFIMRLPGRLPENIKIDEIVEAIDIAPTILKLVGINIPNHFEGKSLLSSVFSREKPGKFLYAYSEWQHKVLSIRTDKYRYVYNPDGFSPPKYYNKYDRFVIEREELHRIIDNFQEIKNIADLMPDITKELRKKLREWNNFDRWAQGYNKSQDKNIPQHIKEHLRSLGYF